MEAVLKGYGFKGASLMHVLAAVAKMPGQLRFNACVLQDNYAYNPSQVKVGSKPVLTFVGPQNARVEA